MRDLLHALFDLLLPPACARCGGSVGRDPLCVACLQAIPRLPRGDCSRCRAAPAATGGRSCTGCGGRGSHLEALVAEVPYVGEIERFVQRFKYPSAGLAGLDPGPEAFLGWLLLQAADRLPGPLPDWVVPVPQHPAGLRRRGFNPAALLARPLARAHGLPFAPRALERLRDGPSQTGLDRRERRRNVASAFRVRPGLRVPRRIWLVDDVSTTGATLEEAARALRRAGARHVVGVCVARTPLGGP